MKTVTEVHDHESIQITPLAEIPKHECTLTEGGAVERTREDTAVLALGIVVSLAAQCRIHAPEPNEIAHQRDARHSRLLIALRPVEFTLCESRVVRWIG